jgi:hypothetical protein
MKTKFNIVLMAIGFCFSLFVTTGIWMNFAQKIYADVPVGYTCSLTANLQNPCAGTCDEKKSCGKNSLDNCDCI